MKARFIGQGLEKDRQQLGNILNERYTTGCNEKTVKNELQRQFKQE